MASNVTIKFTEPQFKAYNSSAKEVFLVGGLGGGKSFFLAQKIIQKASIKGSVGFLGAPTLDVLRDSTWPQIQEAFEKSGIIEGVHYVVNIRPDDFPGVEAFSKLSSNRIVTFIWGSYLLMDGLENFNKRRGSQFDYIAIDEFRDIKTEARKVLLARLRGITFKQLQTKSKDDRYKYQIIYATTPPDDPDYLIELTKKQGKDLQFYFTTSYDNQDNLPDGYIDNLADNYDGYEYRREIKGELIRNKPQRPFMHAFDEERHVNKNALYIENEIIRLSWDFNVDPITCIAGHIIENYESDFDIVHIFKEWSMVNGNTEELAYQIKHWLDEFASGSLVLVTGDATGRKRDASQRDNMTNYEIIKQVLELSENQIEVPRSNPGIKSNRQVCNKVLMKSPEFWINPECKQLIRDCIQVEVDNKGNILKANRQKEEQRADFLDCARYFIDSWMRDQFL